MTRPNIIVMIAHDLGRYLGCYGVPGVPSPNLDRLAARGARLDQAFCSHPQCSPARASITTGRYPHSNGVMGLTHGDFRFDLKEDEEHIAMLLGELGYHTAACGIVHETARYNGIGFDVRLKPAGRMGDAMADQVEAYLQRRAGQPEPFYLQIGFSETHRFPEHGFGAAPALPETVEAAPAFLHDDAGLRGELAQLHAAVKSLDDAVGRILAALEKNGQADNTIVVFTADHGLPFPRAKTSCFDPGIEVALLMAGPGIKPAAHDALLSQVDLLPTLLEMVGSKAGPRVQGRSFAPLLRGDAYEPNPHIFAEMTYHNYLDIIRCIRTARYKLMVNFMPCDEVYNCTQQWRPISTCVHYENPKKNRHPAVELYDLHADPLEKHNRANNAELAPVREDLLRRLATWMRDTDDPALTGVPLPPRYFEVQDLLQAALT